MNHKIDFNKKTRTIKITLNQTFGEDQTPVMVQGGTVVTKTQSEIRNINRDITKFLNLFDKKAPKPKGI